MILRTLHIGLATRVSIRDFSRLVNLCIFGPCVIGADEFLVNDGNEIFRTKFLILALPGVPQLVQQPGKEFSLFSILFSGVRSNLGFF